MKTSLPFSALLCCTLLLAGCHHAPTAHTTLPSVAPLQKTVAATKKTHAQVQQLADQAETKGLIAGSAAAQTLDREVHQEGGELATMGMQTAKLAADQVAAQQKVDATEKERDAERAGRLKAEKERDVSEARSRERLWILIGETVGGLVVVSLLGAQLQAALRAVEKFAAREAVAAGAVAVHAVETLPKVAALAAIV